VVGRESAVRKQTFSGGGGGGGNAEGGKNLLNLLYSPAVLVGGATNPWVNPLKGEGVFTRTYSRYARTAGGGKTSRGAAWVPPGGEKLARGRQGPGLTPGLTR